MTEQEQQKLGALLWDIANQLRGSMNADDFRDYMLSFLFLRYLSANYEEAAAKELGQDYPKPVKNNDGLVKQTSLNIWYTNNAGDVAVFEDSMRSLIHYVIKPEYLWSNIAELARTQHEDLLKTLNAGFKYIEEQSFARSFNGLFSEINLNSEKLGKDYTIRNTKLCSIISSIEEKLVNFSTNNDTLGDAYEYLIAQFASGSGKKAGEFYTPQPISTILSRIVSLDSQDPSSGYKKSLDRILDFACGSGSLLLNVRHQVKEHNGKVGKIYGQEKNITTYNLARMNMLLHGVKDTEFEIFHGDTLANDWDILNELNPSKKITFNAIVANPPFSLKWDTTEALAKDFRFKDYGLAPKSAADFAFLLHGFHFLAEDGVMAIILPHGVLFRGGAEQKIRQKLIDDGHIDTVIGLPANLFFSTGIPVCILILKRCKKFDDVLFINASDYFERGKKQNYLREQDIEKIVETYQYRKEEERYSKRVSLDEIKNKNEYNLNISRYINTSEAEEQIDLTDVNQTLQKIAEEIKKSKNEHNKFLRELGLPELP
ncbi:type I restriction-modification system subunit M [Acinetobacter baumannii]|uniref:type I restriction-modification system subunit M n=1 Tax=Acinetobacter baumannii TaxID=470 RepID=UPI0004DB5F60|nr:type I restriction-modification system subunit M [Acinetobacter baumannii]MDC4421158.1 type I restriction-modification system subunit M [Acinetobacter baumannii]